MINLMPVTEGSLLKLVSGAMAEVVENIGDGQWVNVRYISHPDTGLVGEEELCHGSDVVSIIEQGAQDRQAI